MRNEEMITIQMTMEEAKQFGNAIQEVLGLLENASEAVDELFEMILPVIVELGKEEPAAQENPSEGENDGSPCQDCILPCLANPNYMKKERGDIPDDDSEGTKAKRREFLRIYKEQLLKELKDLAVHL